MASIYNGLIYNDDVDMAAEDNSISPASIYEVINDISTYTPVEPPSQTAPEPVDIDPSDTITRVIDGWTPNLSPNGGTPGETYIDTPPTEKPANPGQRTKTIYAQTQIIITDYSASYLQGLAAAGADFYVVYSDDTRDQVTVSEIVDPHPSIQAISQIEAESIAKAINQYFWTDTNGVHVTDTTKENWAEALEDSFPDWPTVPYHNILLNSLGLLLRTQLINLASISRSGIAFYDGQGNNASNVLASFGINGSLFRADGRDIMRVTPTGVVFVPLEGNEVSVTMITDNIANLTNTVTSNKNELDLTIANLQAQIDGVIDTYYEEVDPEYTDFLTDSSGNNVVDSTDVNIDLLIKTPWMYDWVTDDIKAGHEGDLYYNIDTGHAWRWLKVDNVWQWYRIADSDVAQALELARNANTLAGSKKRVFTSTPTVPYDVGDLWVDGSQVKYANTGRAVGSNYVSSDWVLTATDDTTANTALNKANDVESDLLTLSGEVTIIQNNYVNNATYEQNNRTWSANLNTLENSVKQYSDGLISTEVVNRNAAINAESNSIRQVVAANYQAKGDYATNTALANEVTARNAAIATSAGNILQQVSETYVNNTTLGTYVNQTAQDITTIIGDQNTIKSVVYQHDAILNEISVETLDKINAYYAANDPIIDDEVLTDSSGNNIKDNSDNNIDIFRYLSNNPIYNWNSTNIRNKHVDDLFINTTNSHIWRYTSNYTWEYIENTDATNAVQQASQAITDARNASQAATTASESATSAINLAGSKKRVFTTTPEPPYDIGDLWVTGSQTKYSSVARSSGNYDSSDWHVTSTDDTNLLAYQDTIATIIRETSSGVLVAKSGASIGTLQGSSNFKVVGINSWSGSTPTIGNTYALFGANGLSVYDNTGTSELTFIGVQNNLPFSRLGKSDKGNVQIGVNSSGNGYIDFYNGSTLLGHIGYDAGINSGGSVSNAPYWTFGSRASDSVIGNYSFSVGLNNTASGYLSNAEGYYTTASGSESHAEGIYSIASGYASHAEGDHTTASGSGSHAEGGYTTASGYESHAAGHGSRAEGDYSCAEGSVVLASNTGSHAEGYRTTASGEYSHAEGAGTYSIVDGEVIRDNGAIGKYSHSEGYETRSSGYASHAEGYKTISSGQYSHAEGNTTKASGKSSHAEGNNTTASGDYSHAEGTNTTASGAYSHTMGVYTVAGYSGQTVVGKWNKNVQTSLFEVGNGDYPDESRKNAFTVLSNGNSYINGTTSSNGTAVTSDARIKTLIDNLKCTTAIDFIKQLKPKHYYKDGIEEYGFYAQDIETIPDFGNVLVKKDNSGLYDLEDYRLLNYQGLIAPIVSALQNVIERLENLETC